MFELVLNLKTAKTMGVKFPQSIFIRADRVIEKPNLTGQRQLLSKHTGVRSWPVIRGGNSPLRGSEILCVLQVNKGS